MNEILLKLQEDLVEIFPEISTITLTPESQLQEIPEWDSMASINLLVFLKENFNIQLEQSFLSDDRQFKEIIELIEETVA